jgi:hypothetical protein
MLESIFHAWERRLADATTDRVVRPFEWGVEWIPPNGHAPDQSDGAAAARLSAWIEHVVGDTNAFFTAPPTDDYSVKREDGQTVVSFPSALETPHPENNTVYARYFPADAARRFSVATEAATLKGRAAKAAVVVLPQWNADANGHVGLCKLLAWNGLSALRLSLPYHDRRMPPELHRADYIVSANLARTVQVCRQAVLDARRAVAWLARRGYERIGILGTSLGSCLALLTTAHEPLVRAQALNHISPYFADVVWRGLSTRHVRAGLDGHIDLDRLRDLWRPISPRYYLDRLRDRRTLLVYARYDLSFPRDLSEELVRAFQSENVPHEVAVLPCGHYSTGKAPFKFADGWILARFLRRALTN